MTWVPLSTSLSIPHLMIGEGGMHISKYILDLPIVVQCLRTPLTIIIHLETRGRLMLRNLTQLQVRNIFLSVSCIEKE